MIERVSLRTREGFMGEKKDCEGDTERRESEGASLERLIREVREKGRRRASVFFSFSSFSFLFSFF